jgi:pyruvate kinase
VNVPDVLLPISPLTDKDRRDLDSALQLGVDWVALSFVQRADDIAELRKLVGDRAAVMAKMEKPGAIEHLDDILAITDGLMVARGDLGVEIPLEQVPLVQKRAIRLARERARPVIVATQMLESMIHHSRPTRAEASDVANAALDGADALMLSAETSVGEFPIESAATMARLIEAAEVQGIPELSQVDAHSAVTQDAIASAAARIAGDVNARALVAFTQTGQSARRVASHRERIPLLAFTTEPAVRSQLALCWGVETFVVPAVSHTDAMVEQVDRALLSLSRCSRGDLVVVVAGTPPGAVGSTNTVRVHRIGSL